jgi:hypothetical protein
VILVLKEKRRLIGVIKEKIEKMSEKELRDINVFIAGIEATRKIVSVDEK